MHHIWISRHNPQPCRHYTEDWAEYYLYLLLQQLNRKDLPAGLRGLRSGNAPLACPTTTQSTLAAREGGEGLTRDETGGGDDREEDQKMLGPERHHARIL